MRLRGMEHRHNPPVLQTVDGPEHKVLTQPIHDGARQDGVPLARPQQTNQGIRVLRMDAGRRHDPLDGPHLDRFAQAVADKAIRREVVQGDVAGRSPQRMLCGTHKTEGIVKQGAGDKSVQGWNT